LDGDRAYDVAGLAKGADALAIETAIREKSEQADQLHVCIIDKNLESVLEAIGRCHEEVDLVALRRALNKVDRNARDQILKSAAIGTRNVRECVLAQVPSLKALVDRVVDLIAKRLPDVST
jgi:hypothetical protein